MRIVTNQEMYQVDDYMMNTIGMSEESLMENAGQAAANALSERIEKHENIGLLIGTGNNGGDGFVIARALKSKGYEVDVWVVPAREKIKGAAKKAMIIYENAGFTWQSAGDNFSVKKYTVLIDCLLGIGVKGSIKSPYDDIIKKINDSKAYIYSIDVPSGVMEQKQELTVRADATITLQQPKITAFTYPSKESYGELIVVDIGMPPLAIEKSSSFKEVWSTQHIKQSFPIRHASSNKGTHGKGIVIGGSIQTPGAPMLTSKAALTSGAGLLTLALPSDIHAIAAGHMLEVMYKPCPSKDGFFAGEIPLEEAKYDAIAVGPGLGRTKETKKVVEQVLYQPVSVVVDADALFHLPHLETEVKEREHATILTPHPGEMARLVDTTIAEVEANRFSISRQYAVENGVYLVLKGPNTIVTTPDGKQYVNTTGNAGLAKGGTGDTLTGIILALIMQHDSLQEAISNAVYVHGKAADVLLDQGHTMMDMLASDVISALPAVLGQLGEK
ncbi:NAD(P)H-hydrate epimerase [Bacillus aryabhattai]|uniref:Bifunctional NAD(P)H-hydrate repair enzyme n=1 Tax=Priestia aryabhattai TaxID=412384 RepID=A0A7W3N8W0_PRIAR|nr:NAD(P)H-hydrate dehydratase [Priestia aryabhattai]MBA9038484.1 NAD(P)H-hydrate epimerase [Priestia aryabhattai]